jgi:hypothetical protein
MPVQDHLYDHDIIGTVLQNNAYLNGGNDVGANLTLSGTQQISIQGQNVLEDEQLQTTILDTAGSPVSWYQYYTNAAGFWAQYTVSNSFTGYYNLGGTVTQAVNPGPTRFTMYTMYVTKDNINSSTPTYIALLNTTAYSSLANATTAISAGTTTQLQTPLASVEPAQLGYIVHDRSIPAIVYIAILKSTLRQTLSTSGSNQAALINVVASSFSGVLNSTDVTVQAALNTIDNYRGGLYWVRATVTQTAAVNTGYIIMNATPANSTTITLPAAATTGDNVAVQGYTSGGWGLAQQGGQSIIFGNQTAASYLQSTNQYDAVRVVCISASNLWSVEFSVGNLTVV